MPPRLAPIAAAAGLTLLIAVAATLPAFAEEPAQKEEPVQKQEPSAKKAAGPKWTSLFDGKSLAGWKPSDFLGRGEVAVKEGTIVLGTGMDMTGITIDRKIPKVNYLVELEAKRTDGSDFFCGFTFPVGEEFCSLIVGGWGGGVIGLSSLNGFDASENQTTTYREFENGKWYPVKLRVTDQRITAWIEGKEMVDADIRGVELDTRLEVEWSKPFGIATWNTAAALRKLRLRELTEQEVKAANDGLPAE